MIQDVTDSDLQPVRAFLEAHLDSSLFLLSNLALFGPVAGEHPNSGNFRYVAEEGRVVAVFCLTRRGNLLVQAAGRADLAEDILGACDGESVEVTGIVGEWLTAQALWNLLCADPSFEASHSTKELLYGRALADDDLDAATDDAPAGLVVRSLEAEDFDRWEPLNTAYLAELNLPWQATLLQRKAEFEARAQTHRWWGVFEREQLVAIAGLNAVYGRLGQVGGVYSRFGDRRKGLGRVVMRALIRDSVRQHHFERLVLFTGEDNVGARRLYESLGFEAGGAFALFLGTRNPNARSQQTFKWLGQSGEIYTYEVHDWPTRLSPGPGNYIFTRSAGPGDWQPILIGESVDLADLTVHGGLRAGQNVPTHVHVRLNFNPAAVRRREVGDLAARWTPRGHGAAD